eukprot:gene8347-biopygen3123
MPECLRGHGYSMDSPECRRVLGTEALHPPGGQCGIPHAQASAGTGRKPVARAPVEGELLSPTRVISVPRTRRPVWHLLRGPRWCLGLFTTTTHPSQKGAPPPPGGGQRGGGPAAQRPHRGPGRRRRTPEDLWERDFAGSGRSVLIWRAGHGSACPLGRSEPGLSKEGLGPGENGSGRGPDAGRTIEFEEADADRTRAWPFLPARPAVSTDRPQSRRSRAPARGEQDMPAPPAPLMSNCSLSPRRARVSVLFPPGDPRGPGCAAQAPKGSRRQGRACRVARPVAQPIAARAAAAAGALRRAFPARVVGSSSSCSSRGLAACGQCLRRCRTVGVRDRAP